ncbi:MAG: hypothetical protein KGM42_05925 [Hyphomicrobiales bacterium]|nr:hypothetical protein [Hyphomicrobiales bacterium]
MSLSDFERLLEKLIPGDGRKTLTLTEAPADLDEMVRLLERAVAVGNRRGAPLVEIFAPLADFPHCPSAFFHVPIEDSTREGVVRLVFEKTALSTAA